jgi:integral membrane sensor domain MASE1
VSRRDLAAVLVTAAAYYAGARIGLLPALVRGQVTPFWPPTGIAVVCLLTFGLRSLPGVALASFAVNMPLGPNLPAVVGIAIGNTVAPLAAVLALRALRVSTDLARLRDGVLFVSIAVSGMAISATVGTEMLRLAGGVSAAHVWATWSVWWAGDAMGVLVVAPALLHLRRMRPWQTLGPARLVEGAATLALVALVVEFGITSGSPAGLLICPLLVLSAFRFRQLGVALVALEVSVLASATAAGSHGVFDRGGLTHSMLMLQLFNASIALTGLLLAAAVSQLDDARRDHAVANLLLSRRVEQRGAELDRDRSHIAVLADRHRIATQLQDTLLQRLFGLGMALENATATCGPDDRKQLARIVDQLDATINDLAVAIYQVEDDAPNATFRDAIDHVVAAGAQWPSPSAALVVTGEAEQVPLTLRPQVLAALHEGLGDIAGRPGVRRVDVSVDITAAEIAVRIAAEHAAMRSADPQAGIHRAAARVRRIGGTCHWQTAGERSTVTFAIPTV